MYIDASTVYERTLQKKHQLKEFFFQNQCPKSAQNQLEKGFC